MDVISPGLRHAPVSGWPCLWSPVCCVCVSVVWVQVPGQLSSPSSLPWVAEERDCAHPAQTPARRQYYPVHHGVHHNLMRTQPVMLGGLQCQPDLCPRVLPVWYSDIHPRSDIHPGGGVSLWPGQAGPGSLAEAAGAAQISSVRGGQPRDTELHSQADSEISDSIRDNNRVNRVTVGQSRWDHNTLWPVLVWSEYQNSAISWFLHPGAGSHGSRQGRLSLSLSLSLLSLWPESESRVQCLVIRSAGELLVTSKTLIAGGSKKILLYTTAFCGLDHQSKVMKHKSRSLINSQQWVLTGGITAWSNW